MTPNMQKKKKKILPIKIVKVYLSFLHALRSCDSRGKLLNDFTDLCFFFKTVMQNIDKKLTEP